MIRMETKGSMIRDYINTDIDNYIKLFMNPKVQYYLPHLRKISIEENKNNFEKIINESENTKRRQFRFALMKKDTNIGTYSCNPSLF